MIDVKLINVGEVRFGPSYYELMINGILLKNRIFGDDLYWSDDKNLIVIQEWLTLDYSKGPITRPFIINTTNLKYSFLSEEKKGFSTNFKIDRNILLYTQEIKVPE
ncbi:hypothetical protein [Alkaliphilus oremlandii]|uniref:Uncharacterized protein n=1 Tax=Alkaliphilus oremlandii (strain OhILAs) TaxID=350688 RepID=A8MHX8_ALKOO|nr:hypothetical protein [Alkaliphilus oremlandii]ABW19410.1 hypothetical protein Clos_1870 [Alkaliphilus oremlandii OhILAs]